MMRTMNNNIPRILAEVNVDGMLHNAFRLVMLVISKHPQNICIVTPDRWEVRLP